MNRKEELADIIEEEREEIRVYEEDETYGGNHAELIAECKENLKSAMDELDALNREPELPIDPPRVLKEAIFKFVNAVSDGSMEMKDHYYGGILVGHGDEEPKMAYLRLSFEPVVKEQGDG